MQSKSPTEKDKYYMISLICEILKKIQQTREYNKKSENITKRGRIKCTVEDTGVWESKEPGPSPARS